MSRPVRVTVDFLASYGLACALFVVLLLITFLGTLEQVDQGLYQVKERYFTSLFFVHRFFDVAPVPLPGVFLLLSVLAVNLLLGGVIRMRKNLRTAGVFIAHAGILLMLVGGFVKLGFADEGYLSLFEGERSGEFESYTDWEVAIWKDGPGPVTEYIIPGDAFTDLTDGRERAFTSEALPFGLKLRTYAANCLPQPTASARAASAPVVDGFFLLTLPRENEVERNIAGLYAEAVMPEGARPGILWGAAELPWAFEVEGEVWAVDLRRKRMAMPFTIVLEEFTHEFHPGTRMPRLFRSEVIKIDGEGERRLAIAMNEPLRYEGYTLYQASWGPQNAPPGTALFSTFAVVRDPAEWLPLWSSLVVSAGLTLHFGLMLARYLRKEPDR